MPDVQARMFPLALLLEARAVLLGDCLATICRNFWLQPTHLGGYRDWNQSLSINFMHMASYLP